MIDESDKRVAWTNERIAMLRNLFAEGLSAAQMAHELGGGLSRSAVIGKCNRLGLVGRKNAIKSGPKPRFGPRKRRMKLIQEIGDQPIELPVEEITNPIRLLDLEPHHCRWPVGGDRLTTLFCGRTMIPDHSYCASHWHMAHATSSRTMSRAEKELYRRMTARKFRTVAA